MMIKKWRRSLSARIALYLSLILSVSMLISTGAALNYFWRVMREQILSDELGKLRQLKSQLEYQIEDIFTFAKSITVDPEIQRMLRRSSFDNEFQRTKNRQEVANKLTFYNSLRTYSVYSLILTEEGEGYSSKGFQDSSYYDDVFSSEPLADYADSDERFSRQFVSYDLNIATPVFYYKASMRDIERPTRQVATLFLQIHAQWFLQPAEAYSEGYSDAAWRNAAGEILYQKNSENIGFFDSLSLDSGVIQTEKGYLVQETLSDSNWILAVYITDGEIAQRLGFVAVFFALFFLVTLSLMILIIRPVLNRVVRPIVRLTDVMATVREGDLSAHPYTNTQDEIAVLYQGFNDMLRNMDAYMKRQKLYEQQKKDLEFEILMSQINPHYLYNVLNTVVYLAAAEKNTRIVEIVNAQINVLQDTLKIGENALDTTVENEMRVIEGYLTIQKYRYPDRFIFHADVDKTLLEHKIPKSLIQPLVENAIFHGLIPKERCGNLWVSVKSEVEAIVITVRDDGIGMSPAVIEKLQNGESLYNPKENRPHIGLANIRDRLRFIYDGRASIQVESMQGEYTQITITIPVD